MKKLLLPLLLIFLAPTLHAQMSATNYNLQSSALSLHIDVLDYFNNDDGLIVNDLAKKRRKKKRSKSKSLPYAYGVVGGLAMYNIGGKDADLYESLYGEGDFKSTIGIQAGVVGVYNFMDNIGVKSGLIYTQKGFKFSGSSSESIMGITTESEIDIHDVFNYLTLPILGHYTYGESIKFYGNLGPTVSIFTGGTEALDYSATVTMPGMPNVTDGNKSDGDLDSDMFKKIEIGAYVGGGVIIPVIKKRRKPTINVMADLGYNIGLTSAAEDGELKNKGLGIAFGVLVGL